MDRSQAHVGETLSAWTAGADAVIEWGVKRSLLDYMAHDASFTWTTSGGALFSVVKGAEIPAEVSGDGSLCATGAVTLRAHDGALTVPLVEISIAEGYLTIADPVDGAPMRLELVRLDSLGDPVQTSEGVVHRFSTTLTRAADTIFLYNYAPGSEFDELLVRFPASAATPGQTPPNQ